MPEPASPMPSYGKPPVIEAVWSAQFAELSWLLPPHTGLFWDRIREDFPSCEEHPPIAHTIEPENVFTPPSPRAQMLSAPPLSRQWFVSSSGNELIQLQRDRLCCNWRKVAPADVYPRYQHMRDLFQRAWEALGTFAADMEQTGPCADQCEMTYINHVDQGEGWNAIQDVGRVLPVLAWAHPTSFLPAPATLGAKLVFGTPGLHGRVHVSISHGIRMDEAQEGKELFIVELTARGAPEDTGTPGLLRWFASARETLVRGFTDLTTPAMHKLWERQQ